MIRIPGWARNQVVPSNLYTFADGKQFSLPKVSVNNRPFLYFNTNIEPDGYLYIGGKWKKGDKIKIHFDMEPRTIRANENVEADRGMLCVERGPLVYCIEHPDNTINIKEAQIGAQTQFKTGKTKIAGTPVTTLVTKDTGLTLIPYYAWCHRGKGNMRVWIPEKK